MKPSTASETLAQSCVPQVAENYARLSSGRTLLNLVDRDRGY